MGDLLFYLDAAVALSIPSSLYVLYRQGRISRSLWYMFWLGVLIGSTWELGFYFVGPEFSDDPVYVRHEDPPVHPVIPNLLHTLWDGGLFVAGVGLVNLFCKPPRMQRFRLRELAVMLAWGLGQELAVELIGTGGGMWEYQPKWWNPVLFKFRGYNITLAPQLVWLVAPVAFYLGALKINSRGVCVTGLPETGFGEEDTRGVVVFHEGFNATE